MTRRSEAHRDPRFVPKFMGQLTRNYGDELNTREIIFFPAFSSEFYFI